MRDARVENLAKILVNYSVEVKPGDWVFISANIAAMPLIQEVVRLALQAGGRVNAFLDHDDLQEVILSESSEDQLDWVSPVEKTLFEQADVLISLRAATNTRVLTGIDPSKQRRRQVARTGLMETYMRRAAEGSLRWVTTNFPCQSYAQDAEMSLKDYEDFVYGATFADQADPIAAWQEIHDRQEKLVQYLAGKRQLRVSGPNADLTLSVAGRDFINCDGKNNMPDGEIFTGPVEDSVNGWVRFTYPAINGGREVEGVELRFQDGKVIEAHARKNEPFLIAMLDSDPGARYLGEFAIGTNRGIQRFTRSILFDEKIGGSIHMAVGAGYPETGSKNRSAIHWDFICDMRDNSEISADGEVFYRNGEFLIG